MKLLVSIGFSLIVLGIVTSLVNCLAEDKSHRKTPDEVRSELDKKKFYLRCFAVFSFMFTLWVYLVYPVLWG